MSVASRLCLLASLAFASVITACGSDNSNTTCNDQNLCSAGLVCVDGHCQLDDTGHTGGDDIVTTDDNGGDTVDTDGDIGGDDGFTQDEDIPDTAGPIVTFQSPKPGQVVGGIMTITLTANDPSGLQDKGVVAYVGSQVSGSKDRFSVALTSDDGITFSGTFNTLALDPAFTFPWVGVRATDTKGNETDNGFPVAVDNTPPRVGFSTYKMQTLEPVVGDAPLCTPAFDPLGTEGSNFLMTDGSTYANNIIPRLRIQDEGNLTNTSTPQPGDIISGIDNTNAVLYFWHYDPAVAHFVSSTGGDHCDTINPAVLPVIGTTTPGKALAYNLVPFTSDGDGAPDFESGPPKPPGGACTPNGSVTAPVPVCEAFFAANIFHWLTYTTGDIPAVYGLESYDSADIVYCTGGIFDRYNIPPGPACVAALVQDNAGNTTVTKPIAVCFSQGGSECAGFNAATVRSACSDGCSAADWTAPVGTIGVEVLDN